MSLSDVQVKRFRNDGYLAPLRLFSLEDIGKIREKLEGEIGANAKEHPGDVQGLDLCRYPTILAIGSNLRLVESVSSVLGRDILLWNSVILNKDTGGSVVPWHRDKDSSLISPVINVSVWIAIDDADRFNGCLDVIPSSHSSIEKAADSPCDTSGEDLEALVRERARTVELNAGEYLMFDGNILHHSAPNLSTRRRLALAFRYTVPGVKISLEKFGDGYSIYPVLGCGLA